MATIVELTDNKAEAIVGVMDCEVGEAVATDKEDAEAAEQSTSCR